MANRSKSTPPVSLRALVDCFDMLPQEAAAYLDVQTGEILELTEDLVSLVAEADLEGCSDWEREVVEQVRTLREEDRLLDLPSRFDLNDYDIMSRFAYSWEPRAQSEQLLKAIAGKGAPSATSARKFSDWESKTLGIASASERSRISRSTSWKGMTSCTRTIWRKCGRGEGGCLSQA